MKILILGGTGAIGNAMTSMLKRTNHAVYVTSRVHRENSGNITYIVGDAQDTVFIKKLLQQQYYDTIVDFMTYTTTKFEENVKMLLSNTNQYFFLSSSRVYARKEGAICEESDRLLDVCQDIEYKETDEYALAKARQEDVLRKSGLKNWTIIRPYKTYSVYRLQLGIFEKEDWLYRGMLGKTIPFPKDMYDKETTLTHSDNVAEGIIALIGQEYAYGEVYHITTEQHIKWSEVLKIYLDAIEKRTGKRPIIELVDDLKGFCSVCNKYQIQYDCMYNRVFDNRKIRQATNDLINYTEIKTGLSECINNFAEEPKWRGINWTLQFWMDEVTKEKINFWEIKGLKEKLRYLKYKIKKN